MKGCRYCKQDVQIVVIDGEIYHHVIDDYQEKSNWKCENPKQANSKSKKGKTK